MAITILPLLLLAVLLIGLIGLIVGIVLWTSRGSGSANGQMSCGGCGYAVRGLEV